MSMVVCVARVVLELEDCVLVENGRGAPIKVSFRDAATLSALESPTAVADANDAINQRVMSLVPQRLHALSGRTDGLVGRILSSTSRGRVWKEFLTGWSDKGLSANLERLESQDCIRRFAPEVRSPRSVEVGIISGRPQALLPRQAEEWSAASEQGALAIVASQSSGHWASDSSLGRSIRRIDSSGCEEIILAVHRTGIPYDTVCSGLKGSLSQPNIGANRNLLLLATTADTVVSFDDDMHLGAFAEWGTSDECIGISASAGDPRTWTSAPTNGVSLKGMLRLPESMSSVLARQVGGLLRDAIALAPSVTWDGEQAWRDWPVRWWEARSRVSWSGVLGNTGLGFKRKVLFFSGASRKQCVDSRRAYEALTTRGEGRAGVRTRTIAPVGFFAGGAVAFDATSCVPPFPPTGRGEEAAQAAAWGVIDGTALSTAEPVYGWHEPLGDRRDPKGAAEGRVRANNVLTDVIRSYQYRHDDPTVACVALGNYLVEWSVAAGAGRELTERLRHIACETLSRTQHLKEAHEGPSWWRADVEALDQYMVQMSKASDQRLREDMLVEGEQSVLRMVREYGELLKVWPKMWGWRGARSLMKQEALRAL